MKQPPPMQTSFTATRSLCAGLVILVCSLSSTGCRKDPHLDAYVETLYAQQRHLEDQLNELHHEYNIALEKTHHLHAENVRLRGDESTSTDDSSQADDTGGRDAAFDDEPYREDEENGAQLTPPVIDGGTPIPPPSSGGMSDPADAPESFNNPPGEPLNNAPNNGQNNDSEENAAPRAFPLPPPRSARRTSAQQISTPTTSSQNAAQRPLDTRVTHIVLNPYLTQGHDFDGEPGDDGVAIVIEPRNADDEYVPKSGRISIAIIDPAEETEAGRIGRWDFENAYVLDRLKRSALPRGIQFKLPWPTHKPKNAELRVFVRYETADEGRLEANRAVFVNLPGQFSHRWTPKPTRAPTFPPERESRPPEAVAREQNGNSSWRPYR